ncbi:MAG: hypothetical protein K0V04_31720 [Deltaproteobacteria bacterium]|nr:hypothetical protein [Deltaproteobacteria bacterium]
MYAKKIMAAACGAALLSGLSATPAEASGPSQIQCLRMQNEWISECMDGWYGFWTSVTGQLDNCVASFDQAHPECVNAGVSATEGAQEIHEAYGPAGEIIGGAVGIIGGMVGDLFQCAAGAGVVVYVSVETGAIIVTGDGFGDGSVSDETIQELTDSCWNTAANAGILATALVAPELVAGVIIIDQAGGMYDCYDACFNSPDPELCTQVCYQQGAEALALLGLLKGGQMAGELLPPEMLAPEAFGIRFRPGVMEIDPNRPSCRMTEEGAPEGPECLDDFFTEFRCRIGDPECNPNTVEDYGFSGPEYFEAQVEMLNTETGTRFGGEFTLEAEGLTEAQLIDMMNNQPVDTHGLGVGHGHPIEPNHGFYIRNGPGGVGSVGSNGYPWPTYDLYIYQPPPPPVTPPPPGGGAGGGAGQGGQPPMPPM